MDNSDLQLRHLRCVPFIPYPGVLTVRDCLVQCSLVVAFAIECIRDSGELRLDEFVLHMVIEFLQTMSRRSQTLQLSSDN